MAWPVREQSPPAAARLPGPYGRRYRRTDGRHGRLLARAAFRPVPESGRRAPRPPVRMAEGVEEEAQQQAAAVRGMAKGEQPALAQPLRPTPLPGGRAPGLPGTSYACRRRSGPGGRSGRRRCRARYSAWRSSDTPGSCRFIATLWNQGQAATTMPPQLAATRGERPAGLYGRPPAVPWLARREIQGAPGAFIR